MGEKCENNFVRPDVYIHKKIRLAIQHRGIKCGDRVTLGSNLQRLRCSRRGLDPCYGPDCRRVRIHGGERDVSLLQNIQTGSGAQTALFAENKLAGA